MSRRIGYMPDYDDRDYYDRGREGRRDYYREDSRRGRDRMGRYTSEDMRRGRGYYSERRGGYDSARRGDDYRSERRSYRDDDGYD